MNKKKRSRLTQAQSFLSQALHIVEDVKDDEQDDLDNLPEGFQDSDQGQKMEEVISLLDDAMDSIAEASSSIDEAIS